MTTARFPTGRAPGAPVLRSASLRILMVVDSLAGGGAERHVVDLSLALRRAGHDVAVACSTPGVLAPLLEADRIPVHPLVGREVKRRSSLHYAWGLRRLLARWPTDVIHAHIYASAFAAAAATVGKRVPLIVTEHTEAPWRSARTRTLSWWIYRRAAHVVAVSSSIERLLISTYGVPADKVSFVLPAVPRHPSPGRDRRGDGGGAGCGADGDGCAALARDPGGDDHARSADRPGRRERPGGTGTSPDQPHPQPGRRSGAPLVAHVGRLQPEKGVDVFLQAAARVAAAHPGARFLLVGDGPLRDELTGLAHRLGLADRVDFCGFRGDARSLIEDLDVLVVSSRNDGSPLVVLEAMAAGVPVVATSVGGIPDQVRHGREGLLVPPDDPARLAAATSELLADPERARAMGAAGRLRAGQLGHDRMVARLEETYGRVVARRRWFPDRRLRPASPAASATAPTSASAAGSPALAAPARGGGAGPAGA